MPGTRAHLSARRCLVLSLLACSLAGSLIVPGRAAAWGSIAGGATHQFILDQAYALLKADPAFDPAVFPTLAEIQAHEGVNWFGTDAWFDYMVGPGPDSEGSSSYSDHYYNPQTTEGNGPGAAADQFVALANGMAQGSKDAAAKGAAWGAHFLADMYVPFHVVGAYRDTVQRTYTKQGGSAASSISLPADVTGPIDLCYRCAVKDWSWFGADNFKTEVGRFLGMAMPVTPAASGTTGNAELDWFDPWYYNGTWPASVKSSSHVVWETVVMNPAVTVTGYDARWHNPTPTFDDPVTHQQALVGELAVAAATETRTNLVVRLGDSDTAINHAIQSAYTVWRASISALRPDLAVEPDPSEPGTYKVKAIVKNVATEAAANVRVRLTVTGGAISKGDVEQQIATDVAKSDDTISWSVKTDKPSEASLKLEVIGSYAKTPDLQYATIQKPLGQPTGSLDVIFCIDVTSSMEDDIDSVKAAASSIVDKIAAKDPGFRVAVIAYRDWNDSEGYEMFHDFAFSSDRGTIIGNINGLTVGGGDDTPEAVLEALMRAIDSKSVGGWRTNINKVVILMGDAPPHDPSAEGYTSASVAQAAKDADPVVIQTVVVGIGGDFDSDAVTSFQTLADLTKGQMFKAEDSTKVVDALEQSIAVITPAPTASDMRWLVAVAAGLLLLVTAAVVMRSSRRTRRLVAASGGAAPGSAVAGQEWSQQGWSQQGSSQAQQGSSQAQPASVPVAAAVPYAELRLSGAGDPAAAPRYPLGPNQRLGQAPDNAMVLNDPAVAAYHAQIFVHGTAYAIADLGSATGTWVNGVRIGQSTWLQSGDAVVIGPYSFTFRS